MICGLSLLCFYTSHQNIFFDLFQTFSLISREQEIRRQQTIWKDKIGTFRNRKKSTLSYFDKKEAVGENNQDMKISFYSVMLFNFLQSSPRCFKLGWAQAKAGQDIPNFWWQEKCWQNVCKVLLMWQQHFCTFCKPALTL